MTDLLRISVRVVWITVALQWLCAIVFTVSVYLGLMAGFNSTIPVFGKPSATELFIVRLTICVSFFAGVIATLIIVIRGKSSQIVFAIVPGLLFAYIIFVLVDTWMTVLSR
jgi:hypothetical protein